MNTLSNLFSAVAAFFGWKREADARANSAPQQARAQGATDQALKDQAAATIQRGDVEQIRKDLAE